MISKFFFFLSAWLLLSPVSYASYFRAVVSAEQNIDTEKRTHILVTSRGNDLGLLPHLSALSKANKIVERYPDEQVIIYMPQDGFLGKAELKKMGLTNFEWNPNLLNSKTLVAELVRFSKIASFSSFGHGAIIEGLFLDAVGDKDVRWYPNDPETQKLTGHFTSDAYATLNACNNGHHLASSLAKMWGIPVAGALTGTHFETLYNDGNFYFVDSNNSKNLSRTSKDMLSSEKNCFGTCFRMKPDNHPYHGHYGKYQKGLNFYKFFCPDIAEEKCLTAMAKSLMVQVSNKNLAKELDPEEYAALAREWLCPTNSYGSKTQSQCLEQLEAISAKLALQEPLAALKIYTPFRGASLQCNFETCYQPLSCHKTYWTIDQCAKTLSAPQVSDTFIQEYIHYLNGYELIKK